MNKSLVLVADYPSNDGTVAMMFVHVRNKYYVQHGIDVTVLNFKADDGYIFDGIKVISLEMYEKQKENYDVLLLHAANIRSHYKFLRKYEKRFPHMIFFYHGHEVMRINKDYPKPFDYVEKDGCVKKLLQDIYDDFKLLVWKKYIPSVADKADFVFVSNWLYNEFKKNTGLNVAELKNHVHIINNSVGRVFEENDYNYSSEKKYDFITIRSNMDGSKYGVDLVDKLARRYPQYQFLVIGKGKYYIVYDVPDNVTWIDRFISQQKMMEYINQSKCGLFLTRCDAQGVIACELATYGIPMITSDIDVCKEIFTKLENVELIDNHVENVNLPEVFTKLINQGSISKSKVYSYGNTVKIEEELICKTYFR